MQGTTKQGVSGAGNPGFLKVHFHQLLLRWAVLHSLDLTLTKALGDPRGTSTQAPRCRCHRALKAALEEPLSSSQPCLPGYCTAWRPPGGPVAALPRTSGARQVTEERGPHPELG